MTEKKYFVVVNLFDAGSAGSATGHANVSFIEASSAAEATALLGNSHSNESIWANTYGRNIDSIIDVDDNGMSGLDYRPKFGVEFFGGVINEMMGSFIRTRDEPDQTLRIAVEVSEDSYNNMKGHAESLDGIVTGGDYELSSNTCVNFVNDVLTIGEVDFGSVVRAAYNAEPNHAVFDGPMARWTIIKDFLGSPGQTQSSSPSMQIWTEEGTRAIHITPYEDPSSWLEGITLDKKIDDAKLIIPAMLGREGAEEVTTQITAELTNLHIKEIEKACAPFCLDLDLAKINLLGIAEERVNYVTGFNDIWPAGGSITRRQLDDRITRTNALARDFNRDMDKFNQRLDELGRGITSANDGFDLLSSGLDSIITTIRVNLEGNQGDIFGTSFDSIKNIITDRQSELNRDFTLFKNNLNILNSRIEGNRRYISNFRVGGISHPLPFTNINAFDSIAGSIAIGDIPTLVGGDTGLDRTIRDLINNGQDGLGNSLNSIFSPNDNFINIGTNFSGGQRELETKAAVGGGLMFDEIPHEAYNDSRLRGWVK